MNVCEPVCFVLFAEANPGGFVAGGEHTGEGVVGDWFALWRVPGGDTVESCGFGCFDDRADTVVVVVTDGDGVGCVVVADGERVRGVRVHVFILLRLFGCAGCVVPPDFLVPGAVVILQCCVLVCYDSRPPDFCVNDVRGW